MRKIAYIAGFLTLTLVSCNKEVIQHTDEAQEMNALERRAGIISTNDSTNENFGTSGVLPPKNINGENPQPKPDDSGGITDPNDDDYSNRKPGKTKK